ncbi:MAG: cation transporter [Bacteroidota bacterium]
MSETKTTEFPNIGPGSAEDKLLKQALLLSIVTIVYNIAEGVLSIAFGAADETLALFGFGADSYVEVISGLGIAHMILRMRRSPVAERDGFERRALRITGTAFFLLASGLLIGAVLSIISGVQPNTTMAGIVISSVSLMTMYLLLQAKLRVGRALNSEAIIADANCTRTCYYLSMILLASSLLFEIFGIGFFDALGSLGIAWFAFSEGREAFEKARSASLSCGCGDHCAAD